MAEDLAEGLENSKILKIFCLEYLFCERKNPYNWSFLNFGLPLKIILKLGVQRPKKHNTSDIICENN